MRHFVQIFWTMTLLFTGVAHASLITDNVYGSYRQFENSTANTPGGLPGLSGFGTNLFDQADTYTTVTDGPNPEFTSGNSAFSVNANLFADRLTIDYAWDIPLDPGSGLLIPDVSALIPMHEFSFSDLDWVGVSGMITGLTLNEYTGFLPFPSSSGNPGSLSLPTYMISTGDHNILIEVDGFTATQAGNLHFDFNIITEHQVVPEPGALYLLSLGIVGLLSLSRKTS